MLELEFFLDFADDHYETFGCWPTEYETNTGIILDSDEVWRLLLENGRL
jgi:hypothetical protein